MSTYHVNTKKKITVDGIEYQAEITKDAAIDFSKAKYKISMQKDERDAEIELIPDSFEFLHEITDIFPLSEYDIKIKQNIYRYKHIKPHVSIHLDIKNRETGVKVYFADGAVLSDGDYDYIRDIYIKEAPQFDWQTAEQYLRDDIEHYMNDNNNDDLFSDKAWDILCQMVSTRYREMKTEGYVDFVEDLMRDIAKDILENSLQSAYDCRENDGH